MIPAALAWVAKSLIDAMMIEIDSSAPTSAAIMPWLWVGLALAVLESVAGSVRTYLSRRLADDLNFKVTTDMLTHAADLDLEFFEDVGKQDPLLRGASLPARALDAGPSRVRTRTQPGDKAQVDPVFRGSIDPAPISGGNPPPGSGTAVDPPWTFSRF